MSITRRSLAGLAAGLAVAAAGTAQAQDWKSKYKELVVAAVPDENASGMTERYAGFIAYLSKQLGVKLWPCQMTMDLMGLTNDDLIDGLDKPAGAGSAISLMKEASIQLFI